MFDYNFSTPSFGGGSMDNSMFPTPSFGGGSMDNSMFPTPSFGGGAGSKSFFNSSSVSKIGNALGSLDFQAVKDNPVSLVSTALSHVPIVGGLLSSVAGSLFGEKSWEESKAEFGAEAVGIFKEWVNNLQKADSLDGLNNFIRSMAVSRGIIYDGITRMKHSNSVNGRWHQDAILTDAQSKIMASIKSKFSPYLDFKHKKEDFRGFDIYYDVATLKRGVSNPFDNRRQPAKAIKVPTMQTIQPPKQSAVVVDSRGVPVSSPVGDSSGSSPKTFGFWLVALVPVVLFGIYKGVRYLINKK